MPPPLVGSIIGLSLVLAPGRHKDDQDDQDVVGDDLGGCFDKCLRNLLARLSILMFFISHLSNLVLFFFS